MRGLVLAGGRGARLRPLTYTLAKQLVPVANKPVLHYVMEQLHEAGLREVGVILSPETADQIQAALAPNPWGFGLTFIVQEEPLGLAHAVKVARSFLQDAPFVMYLGDNLIGEGIRKLLQSFRQTSADAAILLKAVPDPRPFGVAEVDASGRLVRLVEKPREPRSNLALVGVYIFSQSVHQAIDQLRPSPRGELEITEAIQKLLEQGKQVYTAVLDGWWLDCGKKDDLLEANRVVLDQWTRRDIQGTVDDASRIVGRVVLERGSKVKRSEIRGPTTIGSDSVIEEAFVGPYTSIGRGCIIRRSAVEHCVVLDGACVEDVRSLEDSLLGRHTVVRRSHSNREALRLVVGDDAEVLL